MARKTGNKKAWVKQFKEDLEAILGYKLNKTQFACYLERGEQLAKTGCMPCEAAPQAICLVNNPPENYHEASRQHAAARSRMAMLRHSPAQAEYWAGARDAEEVAIDWHRRKGKMRKNPLMMIAGNPGGRPRGYVRNFMEINFC